jgi:hypothetical protein
MVGAHEAAAVVNAATLLIAGVLMMAFNICLI